MTRTDQPRISLRFIRATRYWPRSPPASSIVKMTAYHTNLDANATIYRDVRGSYFPNKAALPGHTLLQVSRLANPAYQLEVEVIAILPARG
ncbi:MAG TPA: Rid family hydrolase [Steroidobacteraceae bacterium]|jgi:enamine deaminase RidA (YjgF/YER057c/UK114 family)